MLYATLKLTTEDCSTVKDSCHVAEVINPVFMSVCFKAVLFGFLEAGEDHIST